MRLSSFPSGMPSCTPTSLNYTFNSTFPSGVPTSAPTVTPYVMYGTLNSQMMLGTSVFSCAGSLVIILIFIFFPSLRKKTYIEIVFYSAISDFAGAISTSFGELQDNTALCWAQGFMSNWFPLSSVFWTVAVTYLMYAIIVTAKPFEVTPTLHLICWGFPLLVALLPMTTNRYGAVGGVNWCFIQDRADSPSWGRTFWTFMSFYAWIALCLIIIIIIISLVSHHAMKLHAATRHISISTKRTSGVNKLWLYPVVILLCWLVPAFTDIYETLVISPYPLQAQADAAALVIPLTQGFFTSVIFLASTSIVKKKIYSVASNIELNIRRSSVAVDDRASGVVNVRRRASKRPSLSAASSADNTGAVGDIPKIRNKSVLKSQSSQVPDGIKPKKLSAAIVIKCESKDF